MKILVIGGTGAIGKPLVECLSRDKGNEVFVIARHARAVPADNVSMIAGDIRNYAFFVRTVSRGFDVIVDLMVWSPKQLKKRLDVIFASCEHYIAMSSSAVYADCPGIITESSPLLIDGYTEAQRCQLYRYHIKKSAGDQVIMNSPYRHWTLIRPSLTFNTGKVTLLGYAKEIWLWRYLHDLTVVIPENVLDKKTTITYGGDVAKGIGMLAGDPKAFGEVVNVASDKTVTHGELLKMYQEILPEICGKEFKIKFIPDSASLYKCFPNQFDIYEKDRKLDRCFSTEKLAEICGERISFSDLREKLKMCLEGTIKDLNCKIGPPKPDYNGWMDRIAGEKMPLKVYPGRRSKLKYIIFRSASLCWLFRTYRCLRWKKYRYPYQEPAAGVRSGS